MALLWRACASLKTRSMITRRAQSGVGGIVVKGNVGDAIYVHLDCILEKFIHQHRALRRGLDGGAHVVA
mgnify:CR=1 FL=1